MKGLYSGMESNVYCIVEFYFMVIAGDYVRFVDF